MLQYFLIIFTLFVFDLGTKSLIRAHVALGQEISVLPFFSIVHATNTGVAFGLFQGRNHLFMIIGILAVLAFVVIGLKSLRTDRSLGLIMAVVIGGAIGNLYDRIVFQRVTDFLDFYVGGYHWPAFNVADSAICIGAGLLIWHNFKSAQQ